MNRAILMGRLTRDPDIRYTNGQNGQMCIARFSLAVDRRGKDKGADFISCVAFGKQAEFAEKYMRKGTKMVVEGRIQTGSYTHQRTGEKVYTTDIMVDSLEFAESKGSADQTANAADSERPPFESEVGEGFMDIPDNADDGMLPFN